ncbi:MAG: class I SAM-dependent methyltransferase [Planctomycetota bacterium]|jgi:tRNA (cmo5U34)-methyltransferase
MRGEYNADEYFSRVAGGLYDSLIRKAVPGYEDLHRLSGAILTHDLPKDARVLVVGSGTGMEVLHLSRQMRSWRFVACDINEKMCEALRRRVLAAGLEDSVEIVRGSVSEIQPQGDFDGAVLHLVLNFTPDDGSKESLIKAISKRLKSGATFVFSDMPEVEGHEGFGPFFQAWKVYQLSAGVPPDHFEEENFKGVRKLFHRIPEEKLLAMVREAGFQDVALFYQALMFKSWSAKKT